MKKLFILYSLLILSVSVFAQSTPVDPPKPQEIKAIRGTFTIHASTNSALVVKCINSSDICVLVIVKKSADNMGTNWGSNSFDYELPAGIREGLNPEKNYLGVLNNGSIRLFEVNSVDLTESTTRATTINVEAGYNLQEAIERNRE